MTKRKNMADMNNDIRNLTKWLNEEQEAPIDRQALARVLAMAEQPAQQEPVAHCEAGPDYCPVCYKESKPTYGSEEIRKMREVIANQAKIIANFEPLTDEQRRETINHAWNEYLRGEGHDSFGWYLSQAIEDAHNIKENT